MDVAVQTLWFLQLFCIVWSPLSYPWNHIEVAPLSKAVLKEWLEPKFLSHGIRSWWCTLEYIQRTLVRLLKVFLINIASLQVVSSQIIDVCRLYMGRRVVSFTIVYCWFSTVSTSANLFYHGKRWFCVVCFFFPKTENYHFPFFFFQFDKRNQISGGGVEFVFGGHGFVVWFGFFFQK